MKRGLWKLVALMALSVLPIFVLPAVLQDPSRELKRWMPGASVRVNIRNNGNEMLSGPSNGRDRTKVIRWIRVRK
jgi:hypothetical protein